jgi:tetratricopeptide (TPR) repeat protein
MKKDLRIRWTFVTLGIIALAGVLIAFLPGAAPHSAHTEKAREIDERFKQGVVMLHAKQYEHALTAFHRVLALDPAMPEAHVNAGFALLGMNDAAAARAFFEGAIALRKEQLNAYYGLAVASERLGDLAAARGAMRTYAHLAPKDDPFRRKAEAALWEWER